MQFSPDARERHTSPLAVLCVMLLSVVLTACFSGPPPKLYLLEPLVEDPLAAVPLEISALGLAVVNLPGYIKDERIASRNNTGIVSLSDNHRWAESPDEAITRVLADRLRFHAGSNVLIEPWPRGYDPMVRIEVTFDRLLREPLGGVDMAGHIQLISGDGRSLIDILPFQFVYYGRGTEFPQYFAATSLAVNDIARMVAEALFTEQS